MSQNFVLNANDANRPNVLANVIRFLSSLPVGKSWAIEVKQYAKTRSTEQNAYHWGVCVRTLAKAMGHDDQDVHEYLCGTHFGWKRVELMGGRSAEVPNRTTTTGYDGKHSVLTKAEFAEYVEFVKRFAAEHGVFIPDPKHKWKDE